MSASTAAVTAGRFTFDGQNLTVDGYGRCDAATLRSHLKFVEANPLFTKTGQPRKRLPRADQPKEFYVAQIIHYGLKEPPATISRDHAKQMLEDHDRLTAFRVPKEVETLEKNLARKWADAQAKAKKQVRQQVAANVPVVGGGGESSKPATAAKRKRESKDAPSHAVPAAATSASPKKPRVDATAKSTAGGAAAAAGGSKSKAAKPAAAAPKVEKPEKKPTAAALDLDAIAGYYAIDAPAITREWALPPTGAIKFALAPSPGRTHLWGEFDFGPVAGHLRSSSALSGSNRTVRFLWRGHDTGEGMQRSGKDYTFSITFQPGFKLKGTFAWLGKFDFTGVRNDNYPRPMHKVPAWKREFWAVNPASFEYESRARWGGWHDPGPARAHVEPNSDTDDDDYDAPAAGPRRKQTAVKSQSYYGF